MPESDRKDREQAPIEDLSAKDVTERDAEQVKGGVVVNDLVISKATDKASPKLF